MRPARAPGVAPHRCFLSIEREMRYARPNLAYGATHARADPIGHRLPRAH